MMCDANVKVICQCVGAIQANCSAIILIYAMLMRPSMGTCMMAAQMAHRCSPFTAHILL